MRPFSWSFSLLFFLSGCSAPPGPSAPTIDLTELTIAEIHAAYTAGTFTGVELVTAYRERIARTDATTNAITYLNPEAVATARALDAEFAESGRLRPLHGIPLIVKDNINVAGMPTTAGALALREFRPTEDATIIRQLREAGAIVLAKSNMAEWAFSAKHTESSTHGTTRNPYDPAYVPAGSSGGTAAAIAANLGTVGLGTDTGNSIRGPSGHNALVGFRTTLGLISREGIVPLFLRNDVVGPMCRTVTDATKVLEAMTGFDPADPITSRGTRRTPTDYEKFLTVDGLRGARIGVLRELSDANPHPEISAHFSAALTDMVRLGATVIDSVAVSRFAELRRDQWCATFRTDLEYFLAAYVKNDSVATLEDIVRIGSNSEYATRNLESALDDTGRYGASTAPCGDAYTDPLRVRFRNAIEHTMDSLQLDAIVYPTWNHPPALVDSFEVQYLGDNSQIICPHTGQPGFTVPMGFTSTGLPTGLQFVGRMFAEPTLISLCYAYEQGTLHRKAPPE